MTTSDSYANSWRGGQARFYRAMRGILPMRLARPDIDQHVGANDSAGKAMYFSRTIIYSHI
jgi:hypothetical protein